MQMYGRSCRLTRVPIAGIDDEVFDDIIDLNVRSMMMCTRYAVPFMRNGGSIINLTSIAARHGGGPGPAMCAGSRGFGSTATKGLVKELVGKRIRVNAVSPGVVVTPFRDKFSTPEQLETMRQTIPMGRLGTVDECVGAFPVRPAPAATGSSPRVCPPSIHWRPRPSQPPPTAPLPVVWPGCRSSG